MAKLGYAAIALAAVLWALGAVLARYLMEDGASFLEITEARAWVAAAGLGLILFVRRRSQPPGPVGPRSLIVVFGLAIAAANYFYYASLSLLPVAMAITIQYTAPGLVVAWTSLVARRRPSARVLGALGLAFAGVVLLAELPGVILGGQTPRSPLGLVACVAAAVAFAAYMVTGERLGRTVGAERLLFWGFMVAGALWVVVQATRGRPDTLLEPRFIPWIVFLAVFSTLAPFLLFLVGLRTVEVSRAGIVSTLEPLAAALIAFVWLGQTLEPLQLAGGLMVVVGIGVVQAEKPAPPEVFAERAAVE